MKMIKMCLIYKLLLKLMLVNCNIVKNNYQHNSRILHTFIPNKSFRQLIDILPKDFIF